MAGEEDRSSGYVRVVKFLATLRCGMCGGHGTSAGKRCKLCDGTGFKDGDVHFLVSARQIQTTRRR